MRPLVRGLAAALVALVAATTTLAACTPGPPPPPPGPPAWPGPAGLSGVNGDPVIDRASVEAFCSWRGRPCGIAQSYTDRTSWSSMTRGSGWVFDNFAGFPGLLVVSQSLTPNAGGPAELAACAAGQHDQDFRDFGSLMVAKDRPFTVVRLGWEFNGTFMPWSAWNTQDWIACYRHAALAIRATDPHVALDWTINSHGTPASICGGVSTNCYPGDDVVDIVGIDNYDQGPSAATQADFARVAAAPDGLSWLYDFAVRHGKRFSVGEWGVAPGSDFNSTGENPEFIRWMHDWFVAHTGALLYETYFNNCQAGEVESNLYRAAGGGCVRRNDRAGAVYRELWGA
jgi:hypothetical protein